MLSRRSLVLRGCTLILAGFGVVMVQSSQAEAGAFFRRMFVRNNCRNCYQQVPVQAAPTTATAPAGSYQSNSFEPNASAPAVAPAAPQYYAPAPSSSSRSSYEQFRGDRKALGKY